MRIGFVTCVKLGLNCMEAIYRAGSKISLAITLEDDLSVDKSGRVFIDDFCSRNKIKLTKIRHINDDSSIEEIKKQNLDWLFIIGWSQIASKDVINSAKFGCIGIHPTLLPIGRGRAAIPWAIIKDLDKTGVTLFKLDEDVDTGKIGGQVEIDLNNKINASKLYDLVGLAHEELIEKTISLMKKNKLEFVEQDHTKASYWEGRTPKDGQINLHDSVFTAERLVRATTKPYPGAYLLKDGKKMIIWDAKIVDSQNQNTIKFKDGYLEILSSQTMKLG